MDVHSNVSKILVTCLVVAAAGCGGGPSPTSPSTTAAFSGQALAIDAAGDARPTSLIPTAPDLTSGGVEVSNGTVRLFGTVAAGTLDVPTTCIVFDVDTDQSVSTGAPSEAGVVGADYQLQIQNNEYTLLRCPSDLCTLVQRGVATTSGQTLEARFALSLLGGDDGRMNVKMKAVVLTPAGGNSGPLDFMPDLGAGVTRLQ